MEHIFSDSGEKTHSWTTECKKSFSKAGTLGRHLLMHTGEKPHPCSECEKSLVEMEFWRTICSPTVERSRTDAHSVKRQTKKVVIWELISSFILVRSWFNCQIQFKNIHYAINRGRNEMRKCCIFCPCMHPLLKAGSTRLGMTCLQKVIFHPRLAKTKRFPAFLDCLNWKICLGCSRFPSGYIGSKLASCSVPRWYYPLFLTGPLQEILYFQPMKFTLDQKLSM